MRKQGTAAHRREWGVRNGEWGVGNGGRPENSGSRKNRLASHPIADCLAARALTTAWDGDYGGTYPSNRKVFPCFLASSLG